MQNRAARVTVNVSYEAADHSSLHCDYGWLNVHDLILLDLGVFMYKTEMALMIFITQLLRYIHIIPD